MTQEVEEEVVETPEEEQEATTEEFDYEESARSEGWVSKEEWVESGKPEGAWKPAKDFYEAGQQILPIVQAKNKRLQNELNDLRNRVERMSKTHDMTLKMQREAWEKELKTAKVKAIRDGDGEKVIEIDDQLDQLRNQPSDEGYANPDAQAALQEFMSNNDWYGADEHMTTYADAIANNLRAANPNMAPRELLTMVTAKTQDAFKTTKKKAPTVEAPTRGAARPSKKKDYDSLPSDVRKACDSMIDNVPANQQKEFRQKFVENYYAGETG
jgi:hypothetical protein